MRDCTCELIQMLRVTIVIIGLLSITNCQLLDNSIKGSISGEQDDISKPILSVTVVSNPMMETDSDRVVLDAVKILLSSASTDSITIELSWVSDYAQLDSDYYHSTDPISSVTFAPGETEQLVAIGIKGDLIGEGEEVFQLQLTVSDATVSLDQTTVDITIIDNDPRILSVDPLFPINGSNWNDYTFGDFSSSEDLPINVTIDFDCDLGGSSCTHAGELRHVVAIGEYSCQGLTLTDQLEAFDWICLEEDVNGPLVKYTPVYFVSRGLKDKKYLSDIINADGFKQNRVSLSKDAMPIASSPLSNTWWQNSFTGLSLNSGGGDPIIDLNTRGTIYTLSTTGNSRGLLLSVKEAILVVMPGIKVSMTSTSALSCNDAIQCLVYVTEDRPWIEGDFTGGSATNQYRHGTITLGDGFTNYFYANLKNMTINANGASHGLVIRNFDKTIIKTLVINNANLDGLHVDASSKMRLSYATVYNNGATGIFVSNLSNKIFGNTLTVFNNGTNGLEVGGTANHFVFVKSFGNALYGIKVSNFSAFDNNLFNQVLSSSNMSGGFRQEDFGGTSIILNSTFSDNLGAGVHLRTSTMGNDYYLNNILVNNNSIGLKLDSQRTIFRQLYITNNDTGIEFETAADENIWTGQLFLNNTLNCTSTSSGSNPGLSGANCSISGGSTATRSLGVPILDLEFGPVTLDNSNFHSSGIETYGSITDWTNFDNKFRIWGKLGSRGACTTGDTCQIYDYSLTGTNSTALIAINGIAGSNLTCPSSIHGDQFFKTGDGLTFLINASEITNDYIGNNDGFCESNEACIYAANISFDQNQFATNAPTCVFEDGSLPDSIKDVKMYIPL